MIIIRALGADLALQGSCTTEHLCHLIIREMSVAIENLIVAIALEPKPNTLDAIVLAASLLLERLILTAYKQRTLVCFVAIPNVVITREHVLEVMIGECCRHKKQTRESCSDVAIGKQLAIQA